MVDVNTKMAVMEVVGISKMDILLVLGMMDLDSKDDGTNPISQDCLC